MSKQELKNIEEDIIRRLDWSLMRPAPILFLDRYLKLLGLQPGRKSASANFIDAFARSLLKQFIAYEEYLHYKPSSMALAAAFMAINMSMSPLAKQLDIKPRPNLFDKKFYANSPVEMQHSGPLREWNGELVRITGLSKQDIAGPYNVFLEIQNAKLEGVLSADPNLFI